MVNFRLASVVVVLLFLFPSVAVASEAGPPAAPPDARLEAGAAPALLACGNPVRVAFGPDATWSLTRDAFEVLEIRGASGPVALDGRPIATADPGMPLHVILKTSPAERSLAFACAAGVASVALVTRDAPIVETRDLPARVVGMTFTRMGLEAIGMHDFLDVHVVAPYGANVSVALVSTGTPAPSLAEAFGANASAAVASVGLAAALVVDDPPTPKGVESVLARLALACNRAYPFQSRLAACSGAELENLLARYGIGAEAASDLARSLARDARCRPIDGNSASLVSTRAALLAWVAVGGDAPLPPCLALVAEWEDRSLSREIAFSPANFTEGALFALGLAGFRPDGPCGDRLEDPTDLERSVGNRTLPSRVRECLEGLVASLRPIR